MRELWLSPRGSRTRTFICGFTLPGGAPRASPRVPVDRAVGYGPGADPCKLTSTSMAIRARQGRRKSASCCAAAHAARRHHARLGWMRVAVPRGAPCASPPLPIDVAVGYGPGADSCKRLSTGLAVRARSGRRKSASCCRAARCSTPPCKAWSDESRYACDCSNKTKPDR